MAKTVNPKYRCRKFCPDCGGPLWETRTPIHLKGKNRWGDSDIPNMDGGGGMGRGEEGMGWIHVFPFICDHCEKAYTLERVLPRPKANTAYPEDYWLLGAGSDNRPDSMKTDEQAG